MSKLLRYLLTALVVLAAIAAVAWKYYDYLVNPWTRNGQLTADVLQVAPRVSGPIVELPIIDNQAVKKGDLLFRIDPRTYEAAVDQANARLDATRDQLQNLAEQVKAAEAALEQSDSGIKQAEFAVVSAQANLDKAKKDFDRASNLVTKGDVSKRTYDQAQAAFDIARADLAKAEAQATQAQSARLQAQAELARTKAQLGAPGEDNAQLREAKAALETARLNLEFTEVRASVSGYVTNLTLRLGSQAVANQPELALVDTSSFYAQGFFRENLVGRLEPGMPAVVTPMSYPHQPITGRVQSIGWGIYQDDGSSGPDLLPRVKPTFEWIRLAQRIPVRVDLETIPEGVELRVGTTASVLVRTSTADTTTAGSPVAAPKLLQ
jgi:multidrug resistance efflux pump